MKISWRKVVLLSCLLLSCTGCGFKWGLNSDHEYRTVSIPQVKGDETGRMAAELAKAITAEGIFQYRRDGGDVILKAELSNRKDERINYRFSTDPNGNSEGHIVPSQSRFSADLIISLIEGRSGRILLNPTRVTAGVDSDYEFNDSRQDLLAFSMGQLVGLDDAVDASDDPLYRALAEKVAIHLGGTL